MTEPQIIETLATKVMGWEVVESEVTGRPRWFYQPEKQHCLEISDWNPLQNIADAFQIAEKLCIAIMPQSGAPEHLKFLAFYDDNPVCPIIEEFAETAQKAICNVAIKVVDLTQR